MSSKVISARVPSDVAIMFEKQAAASGLTKSKLMQDMITKPASIASYKQGGLITELPSELNEILSAIGGVGIGLLIFRAVNGALDSEVYSDNERLMIAGASAVAGGLLTGELLKGLLSEK